MKKILFITFLVGAFSYGQVFANEHHQYQCPVHQCSDLVEYTQVQNTQQNGGVITERDSSRRVLARCDFGPEGISQAWLSHLCRGK